ncbi:MAG: rRNA large subunit methyltransferase I, partial [Clostridia bacterium]|nr:rRNA large subunit methyltransferase I [Clostridia bacterium]
MPYTIYLKKNEEKRIIAGHPWVYANEVAKTEGKDRNGSLATVRDFSGRFIGRGFINHLSKILVRIISRNDTEDIDREFFKNKILAAKAIKELLGFSDSYRVVFSESDNLPGLIADKYGEVLCVQFLSLGMDLNKSLIADILDEIFHPVC